MSLFSIQIPANYKGITLESFVAYKSATNDIQRLMAIASITEEQAKEIPLNEVNDILALFEEILKEEIADFHQTFFIGTTEYGFIPNLNKISVAEYLDITTFCKDLQNNAIKLMAVLYRPITKKVGYKYLIEPYNSKERELYEEDIKTCNLAQLNGALLFFSTLANDLTNSSLAYLEMEVSKLMTKS